jgi:predicted permease
MALAIVLLSGSGVLVRSLVNIVGADTGVSAPERVLVASMRLPSDMYQGPEARLAYYARLVTALKGLPGVEEVSAATSVPVNGGGIRRTFEIEGTSLADEDRPAAQFLTVGAGYFSVVGASTVRGRVFDEQDQLDRPSVAIVNRSFAEKHWRGEEAVGRRLRVVSRGQLGEWRTVVGVVSNIMQGDPLRQEFLPLVYVALGQEPMSPAWNSAGCCFNGTNVLVKTRGSTNGMFQAVRTETERLDPGVMLDEFSTLADRFAFNRDLMDLAHAELGKHASVAPVFAAIALMLAAIGLGAVIAHSVNRRTKEIGIRMTIGAATNDVGWMVVCQGMSPVIVGMIVGLLASLAFNRVLQSQLVGVPPYDPMTIAGAPVVLIAVALLACWIPARRAMRVDPVAALRHD